jgi:hypothetical protein
MPKRGRNEPKAKGPHHHLFQNFKNLVPPKSIFQLVSYYVQKGEKVVFSKGGESSISKMVYQNPLEH